MNPLVTGERLDVLAQMGQPEVLEDPWPLFARLRQTSPLHPNPTGELCLLSRHADVHAALRSPRLRRMTPEEIAVRDPWAARSHAVRAVARSMVNVDRPEHTRLRRVVAPLFTARHIADRRAAVERRCASLSAPLLARLHEGDTVDLHSELTRPLAVHVIADLLGIPEARRETHAARMITVFDALYLAEGDEGMLLANAAAQAFEEECAELLAHPPQHSARPDAISLLTAGTDGPAGLRLTEDESITMLWLLWVAGFETSIAGMDNAVVEMLRHPEQALVLDASEAEALMFVEECLRHAPPLWLSRTWSVALSGAELPSGTVPEGWAVGLLAASACRDPAAHPDPDRFVPRRRAPRNPVFGGGIHACLGAELTRLEMLVVLTHLHRDWPALELAGPPVRRTRTTLLGFDRVPVRLAPARP
ncbi:cytochrome P450 [Streptomyces sp. NPDC088350]|uniref:cytochrome P450 n=1 Tax=Streptomyces sp. NPDC088350 TaxID=3365854 RepID=UPI003828226D